MSDLARLAQYAVAGLVGLAAIPYAFTSVIGGIVAGPSAVAEGNLAKLEREAQAKYPGQPTAVALARHSAVRAREELEGEADPARRRLKAAQIFMGAYLVNTRARAEYCSGQGVDVAGFINAFRRLHEAPHARAVAVLAGHRVTEEGVWRVHRAAAARAIFLEMHALADYRLTHRQVCQRIAERAEDLAVEANLKYVQPDVYRALEGE